MRGAPIRSRTTRRASASAGPKAEEQMGAGKKSIALDLRKPEGRDAHYAPPAASHEGTR